MGCSIEDQKLGYSQLSDRLRKLNPKVDEVTIQKAINKTWLSLENNMMTEAEKFVYTKITEQTDGVARINLGGLNQLNEPIVIVKDLGKEYVIHLLSGKNYTFKKGSIRSNETAKKQEVVMPSMEFAGQVEDMYWWNSNEKPIVVGGKAYLSKAAYEKDEKVLVTRRMARKMVEERANALEDKSAWDKYEGNVLKGSYGYDKYAGALKNTIEKLVNPKIVTDVVGLMLSEAHEDNIIIADYSYKTNIVQIAKEPTKEEINDAAEVALMYMYTTKSGVNPTIKALTEFVGKNKAVAIQRIINAVENVRGSHALTHELIHAGSVKFMEENKEHPAVLRVKELYDAAMDQKDEIQIIMNHGDVMTRTRWQENEQEFVAEALSNPGLMYALSKFKVVGKERLSKGIFAELVETLISMLGLTKKVADNLLEFTMDGFTAIMEAQAVKVDGGTEFSERLQPMIEAYKKAKTEKMGSDSELTIGTKASDKFIGQEELQLGQVLKEEFDNYYALDLEAGNPIKTQEFNELQDKVLDTYEKTMQDLGKGKVGLRLFESTVDQTAAQIDLRSKEMHIRWNKMSRLSRVSEVFLHETNHLMSHYVFKNNRELRGLMEDLRDAAIDSGVTYKLFLDGVENPTANEIEIAKMKFEYTFDKTANPEEFYAYATTNEQVYNAIKDVKLNTQLIKHLAMDPNKREPIKKVLNKLIDVVNAQWRMLTGRGITGNKMIANMLQTVARLDAEAYQARQKREDTPEGITDYAKNKINQLDAVLEPVIKKVDEWNEKFSTKQTASFLAEHIKRVPLLNDLLETGISQYLWRMVTQDTTTKDVADMYMVFRHAKQKVEKHTADIRNGVKSVVDELYKDVDADTKKAVTSIVLEMDMAQFSVSKLKEYLTDPAKIENDIQMMLEELLPGQAMMHQINGLVEYLVTGKTITHNQQINANNIVTGIYKENEIHKNASKSKVELVDKLVSLKALLRSTEEQRKLVNDMDTDTLNKTIQMYRGYMDGMRANATLNTYDPIPKGYTKPEDGLIKYELIPEEEVEAQKSVLMKLVNDKPYLQLEGKNYYLMTGRTKSVGFTEGAIGLISHTIDGIPVSSLIRKNNEMLGKKALPESEVRKSTKKLIAEVNSGKGDVEGVFQLLEGNTIIPVYDHQNKLVDYRIQLNKLEKDVHLPDRKTELSDMLSHTFSRSIKTSLTASENKRVVDTIIEHSAQGVLEKPNEYVLVEEYTDEDKFNGVKREKRHDRWDYLPDHTKDYIYQKLGVKGILIHKDFVELMTGEKDVTIGNFAKFGIDLKKYPIAKARLMALESYLAEVLGYVKNAIVVLNADVLLGNQTSNAIVAMTHGIDPIRYTKKFKERWQQLNEYNEKVQQIAELEVRKMAGEKVDNKITQLKRQMKGNVWDELVKDGQYTALVEDINIDENGGGQLYTMVDNYLEKKNWKGAIKALRNGLFIDRTSALYGVMLKTVHYGDAITRQIIKEELERKEIKKYGEITPKAEREILNYLDQLLVNYGYTMNRWVSYMERVGGLFFMKYYLSQAKAITSMIKRAPAMSALIQGTQYVTKIDIQDPFDTYLRSGIDGIAYRWMLDDAPSKLVEPNILDLIPDISSIVKIS